MPGTIRLVDQQGAIHDVPAEAAASALDSGWTVPTTQQELARTTEQARDEAYGGVGGTIKAGLAAGARGLSLGGSDVLARALGGEDTAIALEGYREAHPYVSTGAEFAGALAPAFFTGGAATPAGAVSRLGAGISRTAEGAGTLTKLGRAALGGATEGALYGAGSGVSELALSDDPLTVERVGSALSSNMLFGAGLGAGIGTLAKGAEIGLGRARRAVDGFVERRAQKATNTTEAIESGDLENLGVKDIKAARDAELEAIRVAQRPDREMFVQQLRAAREADNAAQPWRPLEGYPDREIRGLSKEYLEADKKLTGVLKNEKGLVERPGSALDALQRQEQAMERLSDRLESHFDAWLKEADATAAKPRIRAEIEARDPKSPAWKNGEKGPFTSEGLDAAVEREYARRYPEMAGDEMPDRFRALSGLNDALVRNFDLQQKIRALSAPPASAKLTKIEDALEVLGQPKVPSLGAAVLGAVVPFAGPLGAAAATGNRALGSLRNVAMAATERAAKVSSTMLGVAEKGVSAAAPYAPVIAQKVLSGARFDGRKHKTEPADLHEAFTRATDAIKSQIAVTPDGQYQMRPDARAKMAANFDGIRSAAPILADRLEEHGARRIEYLAGEIPRKPDVMALHSGGPDNWRASTMDMASFARKVAAVEDPHAALDRLAHGEVTPDDAAAIRAVYPELMADITQRITAGMPSVKSLPYNKKIALSIFTGQPADPSLDPKMIAALQSMYPNEPGSQGGVQTPRAEPSFGAMKSVSEHAMTPAQERAA